MDLRTLTNENLIFLNADFKNKKEILDVFIQKLYDEGKITSKEEFYTAVMDREAVGATGIGEGLAIPHGKSDAVKEASFVVATLKNEMEWETLDDEDVNLVILLAIPKSEEGSTHVDLLAKLTTKLADDDFREDLVKSKNPKEFIEKLNIGEDTEKSEEVMAEDAKTIVAVTACPAGIAHTYMAAEALEKAGRKLGVKVVVEKQGAMGIEGRISDEDLNKAHAAIFAVEVAVKEADRFDGIPAVETSVADPLRRAEEIIKEALEVGKEGRTAAKRSSTPRKEMSAGEEAKKALLNGISHIVPLIVAGGTVLAIAVLVKEIFGLQELYGQEGSWLWMYRKLSGGMLGTLMVPVLAAYVSFSLADKPGLGPGFAAGLAANLINSGFLGGIAGGFIAGYTMKWVKKNVRGPQHLNGFFTFYLYPVIGTLVAGSLMLFVVGKPVAALNTGLTNYLDGLSGGNAMLLGAIIGAMVSFDLGGPVNKAAYAFCVGSMANGNFMPYATFASCKMVSAFTTTLATKIRPHLYSEEEIQCGNSTWILGLAGITEGAIPLMIEDPFRVIPSFVVGTAVTGAMVAATGIGLQVPGAGIISMFVLEAGKLSKMTEAGIWLGAALVGTVISTAVLTALRTKKHNLLKQQAHMENAHTI
ncbi:PTS 2-O-a-mannosyl-D-glycerate transporter subunit IIABC [uncultured Ilyobacter sp.]|uniref:PTS 2-O-a-mannosyl-D-glycerate transporter subunit IIABC n=1 Tax=uncultured Ilyobacter sp. TaxID=544433 RepID=UPI0029C88A2D|nr:PTS 2-O-a-mannosyl-D-glycerate transporter subunit IIABC [uncultured Ilyobacter sp.]